MPGRLGPGRNLALHKPEGDGSREGGSTERFVLTRKPSQLVAPGTGWLCQDRLLPWSGGSPADEPGDDGVESARVELPQCHPFGVGQGPITDNPHTEAVAHVRQNHRPAADFGGDVKLVEQAAGPLQLIQTLADAGVGLGKDQGEGTECFVKGGCQTWFLVFRWVTRFNELYWGNVQTTSHPI